MVDIAAVPSINNAQFSASAIPIITIDGLTATGKGTIAAKLAQRLGFHCLDSGVLYRLVALLGMRQGLSSADLAVNKRAWVRVAQDLSVRFENGSIFLSSEHEEVSSFLRVEEVGMLASQIAVYDEVRQALLARQRAFARPPGLVADGRDMGTVVFTQARLKIFLTASESVRAQRRAQQLEKLGFSATIESLLSDLKARDLRDQSRSVAPTVPATDAIVLDSSEKNIEEVIDEILVLWGQIST